MQFKIRKMEMEDIQPVQQVARKSWHRTYEGIIPREIQDRFLDMAYTDEMMRKRLQHSQLYVAVVEQDVVGFANFGKTASTEEIELAAIYLLPEYQGFGIGSALLKEGITALDHVKSIVVEVEKENYVGKHFYIAKGFQFVEEYDNPFDGHALKTERYVLNIVS